MVEGYTEDTELVVEGDDEGDQTYERIEPIEPIEPPAGDIDRSQYKVDRPEGDPLGQPQSITYPDGNQVKYTYNDQGELIGFEDTASGVTMKQDANGNWTGTKKFENGVQMSTFVDGDFNVDPETGNLVGTKSDGSTVTQHPDGRTTMRDENGNLTAVSNPKYGGTSRIDYDENGQVEGAVDAQGNWYTRAEDGKWKVQTPSGSSYTVKGNLTVNEHTGVRFDDGNPRVPDSNIHHTPPGDGSP